MKIVLASASDEINTFIFNNLEKASITGIAANKRHLLKIIKNEPPDIVVLSTLLSGEEDLTEIIFKALQYGNCRIILLAKNKDRILQDAFYLGVRDYLLDPISPNALLSRIYNPMTFEEAATIIKPRKCSLTFKRKMELFFNKHISEESVITKEAQQILQGIFLLLKEEPKPTLEENLYILEQIIINNMIKKATH